MLEERISELEMKMSFQDKTIDELNNVIIKQQQQIDLLQKQFEAVQTRLRETLAATPGSEFPQFEKPPHY
jgi:SlyX protein